MEALAQAVYRLPQLASLHLHVVPRTSIERPTLSLDTLVLAAVQLECLELIAGYPEHNPYQKPIVRTSTIAKLFARNPDLRLLTLANLGLSSAHMQALFSGPWPTHLEHLSLPFHARLLSQTSSSSSWAEQLAIQLQDPQHTTLASVTVPQPCLAVDTWTTLNRLGRAKLVHATEGSTAHTLAWHDLMRRAQDEPDDLLRLNLNFALIREHPILATQAAIG